MMESYTLYGRRSNYLSQRKQHPDVDQPYWTAQEASRKTDLRIHEEDRVIGFSRRKVFVQQSNAQRQRKIELDRLTRIVNHFSYWVRNHQEELLSSYGFDVTHERVSVASRTGASNSTLLKRFVSRTGWVQKVSEYDLAAQKIDQDLNAYLLSQEKTLPEDRALLALYGLDSAGIHKGKTKIGNQFSWEKRDHLYENSGCIRYMESTQGALNAATQAAMKGKDGSVALTAAARAGWSGFMARRCAQALSYRGDLGISTRDKGTADRWLHKSTVQYAKETVGWEEASGSKSFDDYAFWDSAYRDLHPDSPHRDSFPGLYEWMTFNCTATVHVRKQNLCLPEDAGYKSLGRRLLKGEATWDQYAQWTHDRNAEKGLFAVYRLYMGGGCVKLTRHHRTEKGSVTIWKGTAEDAQAIPMMYWDALIRQRGCSHLQAHVSSPFSAAWENQYAERFKSAGFNESNVGKLYTGMTIRHRYNVIPGEQKGIDYLVQKGLVRYKKDRYIEDTASGNRFRIRRVNGSSIKIAGVKFSEDNLYNKTTAWWLCLIQTLNAMLDNNESAKVTVESFPVEFCTITPLSSERGLYKDSTLRVPVANTNHINVLASG